MNRPTLGSRGHRSRSHDAGVRFKGLA